MYSPADSTRCVRVCMYCVNQMYKYQRTLSVKEEEGEEWNGGVGEVRDGRGVYSPPPLLPPLGQCNSFNPGARPIPNQQQQQLDAFII